MSRSEAQDLWLWRPTWQKGMTIAWFRLGARTRGYPGGSDVTPTERKPSEEGDHAACWLPAAYLLASKAGGGHQPRNMGHLYKLQKEADGRCPRTARKERSPKTPRGSPVSTGGLAKVMDGHERMLSRATTSVLLLQPPWETNAPCFPAPS